MEVTDDDAKFTEPCPYCQCRFETKKDIDWHIVLGDCEDHPDDDGDAYFGIKRDENGDVID